MHRSRHSHLFLLFRRRRDVKLGATALSGAILLSIARKIEHQAGGAVKEPSVWVERGAFRSCGFVPSVWVLAVSGRRIEAIRRNLSSCVSRRFLPVDWQGERVGGVRERAAVERKGAARRVQVPGSFRWQIGMVDWTGGGRGAGVG